MENISKINIFTLGFSLLCLCIAFYIYIIYRAETIPLVRISNELGVNKFFNVSNDCPRKDWFLYSLPDGLWMLSYQIILTYVWKYRVKNQWYLIFSLSVLIFTITCEFLQFFGIIDGTFDMIDLIFYLVSAFLGLLYCKIINKQIYGKTKI